MKLKSTEMTFEQIVNPGCVDEHLRIIREYNDEKWSITRIYTGPNGWTVTPDTAQAFEQQISFLWIK